MNQMTGKRFQFAGRPAPCKREFQRLVEKGLSLTAIARIMRRDRKRLREWATGEGLEVKRMVSWTPERVARLAHLYAAGVTLKDIAAKMGSTISAVDSAIRNYEIPRRGQIDAGAQRSEVDVASVVAAPLMLGGVERGKVFGCDAARFAALMARTVAHHRAQREAR